MLPISYRFERAGAEGRRINYRSGWRRFGNTLITQIRDGRYLLETESASYEIAAGMGFLVPPGVRTCVSVPGDRSATTVFSHLHCRIYESQGLFTVLRDPIVFPPDVAARVGACNDALIALQREGVTLRRSVGASSLLAELVGIAIDNCPELEAAWNNPDRQRLLPVLQYVQDNMSQPLCRTDLARVAGMSVPHLHALFVRAFGAAPMAMVMRERMQHARQLLHWSDLPIAEVGQQCGFADPYYFSRAFKREEGVPPSRYRQTVRR